MQLKDLFFADLCNYYPSSIINVAHKILSLGCLKFQKRFRIILFGDQLFNKRNNKTICCLYFTVFQYSDHCFQTLTLNLSRKLKKMKSHLLS